MNLIDSLIKDGWLKTPRIIKAFQEIKRIDFLPEDIKNLADLNEALSIGHGQTISQPLVVAFMIEQLQPEPGEKILDIGSGSGWTTALLAQIVGTDYNPPTTSEVPAEGRRVEGGLESHSPKGERASGKIISIELIPELKKFGEQNVAKYNFIEKGLVEFICGDGSKGYKKEAPFNRILASASAEKIPQSWKEQIKINGKIVAPIKSSIWVLEKKSKSEFEEIEYPGFAFVPLITSR